MDINDRLNHEADTWLEREQARLAQIALQHRERRERKEAYTALIVGSGVVLFVIAAVLYLAAVSQQ